MRTTPVMNKPLVCRTTLRRTLMRWASLLALLSLAGTAAAAPISDARLDKVMALSGIERQIGALPAVVKGAVDGARAQAQSQENSNLTDADFDALKEGMGKAFEADPILKVTRDEIRKKVSEADAKQLIAWFESDLGGKVIQAEVDATTPEARKDIAQQAKSLMADKERMAFARKVERLLHATDETLKFQERTVVALYTAVAARMNPDQKLDVKAYRAQVKAALQKARPSFEKATLLGFAYTYRNLSKAEREQYVKFLARPATRRFNDAALNGLMTGIDHAVLRVADNIVELRKQKAH